MIEYIIYRLELARLNTALAKLLEQTRSVETSYKSGEDDQGHIDQMYHRCHKLEQWIEFHKTNYFKKKADKLLIPMPSSQDATMYDDFDFDDGDGPKKILTESGIYQIRELIRNEHKARREAVSFWFAIITGLIGAAIALISVMKS